MVGKVALAAVVGSNVWVMHAASGRGYVSTAGVPARSVAIVPGARVYKGKPFVHLDVAGPAYNDRAPWGHVPSGGTGFGIPTIVEYVASLASPGEPAAQ